MDTGLADMRLTLLHAFGTLLLLISVPQRVPVSAQMQDQEHGHLASCPLSFHPAESCGDGGECPYKITLPPLTVQMPMQFHLLEKTMKELQALKEELNELRGSCLECQPQADQILQRDSVSTSPNPSSAIGMGSGHHKQPQSPSLQEMQAKITRMSNNEVDTRIMIDALKDELDQVKLVTMKNMEAMVDNKVANITKRIEKLNKCNGDCPHNNTPSAMLATPRDCSDYSMQGVQKSGVYSVRPDPRAPPFEVYCNMESFGGGWTMLQRRLNGSVSFNRTWKLYKQGFGNLQGEFWIGNDRIHLLTKAKDMVLRIELQDFDGLREYAKYDQFYVANEFLNYRLSISGYSGTAGDALHFNKLYNHDQKFFTTPDKDNDMYTSGNCGAYYSSGWWFDACMSANLNGKYYKKRYKGVRNGIFWSTWRNTSSELYPTNYRQVFKTVEMMIRPKNYFP